MSIAEFKTLKQIGKQGNIPWERLAYAAAKFNIPPTHRVGAIKLYDASAVQQLLAAGRKIAPRTSKEMSR
jgi:hypothetical protein